MRPRVNRRLQQPKPGLTLKRLLQWVSGTVILLALIALALYFWWDFSHQPIRGVEIASDGQAVSVQKLQPVVKRYVSGDFYTLNTRELRAHLQLLPWVKSVAIRRVWPDKLRVMIHEYHAVALWNETQLVSEHGTLFQPPATTFPADLPHLAGPIKQEQIVLQQYRWLSKTLAPLQLHVKNLSLQGHSWHFSLASGAQVYFNVGEEQQLRGFKKLYRHVLRDKMVKVERVDLRYVGGAAVRWEEKQRRAQ